MGLKSLFISSNRDASDQTRDEIWTVYWRMDDIDGDGWCVSSESSGYGPDHGPFRSKSNAVERAFSAATTGDVIKIQKNKQDRGGEPNLEYVH